VTHSHDVTDEIL